MVNKVLWMRSTLGVKLGRGNFVSKIRTNRVLILTRDYQADKTCGMRIEEGERVGVAVLNGGSK